MLRLKTHVLMQFFVLGLAIQNASLASDDGIIDQAKAKQIVDQLNRGEDYEILQDKISLAADTKIIWGGEGVLVLKAKNGIQFNPGSLIESQGKGGLILNPDASRESPEATVNFEGDKPQIDFSKGYGSVSLFYNPPEKLEEGSHKYKNPQDFSVDIVMGQGLFKAFMLIHHYSDLLNMKLNSNGDYALSTDPCPDGALSRQSSPSAYKFLGTFNYNAQNMFNSKQNPKDNGKSYIVFDDYVFEGCFEERLGKKIFYKHLPLLSDERGFLKAIKKNNSQTVNDYLLQKRKAHDLAFVKDQRLHTPLHIAAYYGRLEILEKFRPILFKNQKVGFSLLERKDAEGKTALDLSFEQGHREVTLYLMNLYVEENYPFERQQMFLKNAERRLNEVRLSYNRICDYLEQKDLPPTKLNTYWQGFPKKLEAEEKESERQKTVHERFFVRELKTPKTILITKKFLEDYASKTEGTVYKLDGLPSRSRIILLKEITRLKLQKYDSKANDYWKINTEYDESGNHSWHVGVDFFPTQYYFGGATHTLENQFTPQKPGYTHYREIGKYEEIEPKIKAIALKLEPKKITKLLRNFRLTGKAITEKMLVEDGYQGDAPTYDALYLMRLSFLLDIEIASRLVRPEELSHFKESIFDRLPIAIACSRIFDLQMQEFCTFEDYLSKTGDFHCFSHELERRKSAIEGVNKKYLDLLKSTLTDESVLKWDATHPYGKVIVTSEQLHQELLENYGGDCESEGEEYEDKEKGQEKET